jgi:serine/threonine protein kinase
VASDINFTQATKVSRKIVWGLMDGLQWLHKHDIIHWDIRPSNLVVDGLDNVVIVDYETGVVCVEGKVVEYMGGFICWPKWLILSNMEGYVPKPEDDLFASMLAVSQMVFPGKYEGFRMSSIGITKNGMIVAIVGWCGEVVGVEAICDCSERAGLWEVEGHGGYVLACVD